MLKKCKQLNVINEVKTRDLTNVKNTVKSFIKAFAVIFVMMLFVAVKMAIALSYNPQAGTCETTRLTLLQQILRSGSTEFFMNLCSATLSVVVDFNIQFVSALFFLVGGGIVCYIIFVKTPRVKSATKRASYKAQVVKLFSNQSFFVSFKTNIQVLS